MDDKFFFKHYLPALEASLAFKSDYDFDVKGPDWFVENDKIREELDLFEQESYENYKSLFDMVAYYLDARAHNFNEIEGVSLSDYKKKLEEEILLYKKEFGITG